MAKVSKSLQHHIMLILQQYIGTMRSVEEATRAITHPKKKIKNKRKEAARAIKPFSIFDHSIKGE